METFRSCIISSRVELFRVKTFDQDQPEVSLKFLLRRGEQPKAGAVKLKMTEALQLKPASKSIFGVFLGTPGSPRELLLDSSPLLPGNNRDVCFQRASFYRDDESELIKEDYNSLKLIFWEAVHAFKFGKILPMLDSYTVSLLKRKLQLATGVAPLTTAAMMGFTSAVFAIPHYFWSFYYRVEHCTLRCSFMANGQELLEGTEAIITMSSEELMFWDVQGKRHMVTWFWDEVHLLRLRRNKIVTFEVVNKDEEICKDVFHNVVVACEQSEYLYSVAVYLLTTLQKRMFSAGRSEIVNPGYRKKLLLAKPRADAYSILEMNGEQENPSTN